MATPAQTSIFVADIFKSIQGEGPKIGTPSIFLRLGICNLQCTWCDTPYTWKKGFTDYKAQNPDWIIKEITKLKKYTSINNLVITGGEPLLQQNQLAELLKRIYKNPLLKKMEIEFETNGSQKLLPALNELIKKQHTTKITFNISPKLADSGNKPYKVQIYPNAILKFVYVNKKSETLINKFLTDRKDTPPSQTSIYLMPEGTTVKALEQKTQKILQYCTKNGFIYTPRLHIYLFGNKRAT